MTEKMHGIIEVSRPHYIVYIRDERREVSAKLDKEAKWTPTVTDAVWIWKDAETEEYVFIPKSDVKIELLSDDFTGPGIINPSYWL